MQLRIEKIVFPGKALAREEGKIIFTDEGLPGELVEVEILKDRKNYFEARTINILEPSSLRQNPVCSHYRACSPYQIMSYDLEIRIKIEQLTEICSRAFGQNFSALPVIPSPAIEGYRNRIKLSLNWDSQPPFLAYHQPGSLESLLPVEHCVLVSQRVNTIISRLNELIKTASLPEVKHLEIRQSFLTNEILLIFFTEDEDSLEKISELWIPALSLDSKVAGAVAAVQNRRKPKYVRLYGRDYLEEKIGTVIFRYGAASFFQVNPPMVEKVIIRIKEYISSEAPVKLADLYAGLGTFGLLLASEASEILAVESDPSNVFYLKKNLRLNRVQHLTVAEGRSEEWVEEILDFKPSAIVIDPPRRGVSPVLIEALKQQPVDLLFYLSCNPPTLARDLKLFFPEYNLAEITGFDFFPRTPHLETLAVLKSRPSDRSKRPAN
jgi:23S rRNA (uracil1939-C5)-methyltransferase